MGGGRWEVGGRRYLQRGPEGLQRVERRRLGIAGIHVRLSIPRTHSQVSHRGRVGRIPNMEELRAAVEQVGLERVPACARACTCVHVHVHVHVCMCTCMCMCACARACARACACVHVHVHVHVCMCTCMCMCACVHVCMCMCACVHVCMCMCGCACGRTRRRSRCQHRCRRTDCAMHQS